MRVFKLVLTFFNTFVTFISVRYYEVVKRNKIMARPKKIVTEPVKALQPENTTSAAKVTSVEPVTNQVALSFYKVASVVGKPDRWEVVKILFDSKSGHTKAPVVLATCDSESEAFNSFKVHTSTTILTNLR